MKHTYRWTFVILLLTGLLAACGQSSSTPAKIEPAKLTDSGTAGIKQLELTEDAVRRLAIKTDQVREEPIVRKRVVGAEVVAVPDASNVLTAPSAGTIRAASGGTVPALGTLVTAGQAILELVPSSGSSKTPVILKAPRAGMLTDLDVAVGQTVQSGEDLFAVADTSKVLVRVPVYATDLQKIDRSQPASIMPLSQQDNAAGIAAKLAEPSPSGAQASNDLYYMVDSANHGLVPGQRVRVQFALASGGAAQKVLPYASIIYDLKGDTWTYTNPAPRTYLRDSITVDYIDGDLAVLSAGPAAGTTVVTAGAAELYGTETGIGK